MSMSTDQCPGCGAEVAEGVPHDDPADSYTDEAAGLTWVQRQAHELNMGDRYVPMGRRFDQRPMPVRHPEVVPTLADAIQVAYCYLVNNDSHVTVRAVGREFPLVLHVQEVVWVLS